MIRAAGSAILLFALVGTPLAADVFSGAVRVVDGDTLVVRGIKVRLQGIDAPERGQICTDRDGGDFDCGERARAVLTEVLKGKPVSCQSLGRDRYSRVLARCYVGRSDIGEGMVTTGLAFAYRHYSTDYVAAETTARLGERGLWAGTFEFPWSWRKEHR